VEEKGGPGGVMGGLIEMVKSTTGAVGGRMRAGSVVSGMGMVGRKFSLAGDRSVSGKSRRRRRKKIRKGSEESDDESESESEGEERDDEDFESDAITFSSSSSSNSERSQRSSRTVKSEKEREESSASIRRGSVKSRKSTDTSRTSTSTTPSTSSSASGGSNWKGWKFWKRDGSDSDSSSSSSSSSSSRSSDSDSSDSDSDATSSASLDSRAARRRNKKRKDASRSVFTLLTPNLSPRLSLPSPNVFASRAYPHTDERFSHLANPPLPPLRRKRRKIRLSRKRGIHVEGNETFWCYTGVGLGEVLVKLEEYRGERNKREGEGGDVGMNVSIADEKETEGNSIGSKAAWWLDVKNPRVHDFKKLNRMFKLHPLTIEDILVKDEREKMEVFDRLGYYFVAFRGVDESNFRWKRNGADEGRRENIIEGLGGGVGAINVYFIVMEEGIITVSPCILHQ
jgi:hypothetical protein